VFSISVGAMLGSGVFVLPGLAAGIAGPWVSLSFLLAGLMVLPAVFSKAELATAMPVAGGTYVYIDRAMGPWVGTITGFGTWGSLVSKTAFVLAGLGAYLTLFADPVLVKPVSIAVLVGLVAINILGVGKATFVQNGIVALCLAALAGFATLGLVRGDAAAFQQDPFPTGAMGIVLGAAFVFNAYAGVTKICSVAEEIHHPDENIPQGMLAAHVTGMVLYAIIAAVVVANVDLGVLAVSVTPITDAAAAVGGPGFVAFMAVIAVLGLVSMSNAGVMSSSRYPFAMGRDWLLPSWTNSLHPRFGTPVPAILLTGAALVLLVFFLPVVKLAKLASAFKIVLFTLVNVAVIVLRETQVRWYKPSFRSPLYPWVQIAGVVGGLALLSVIGTFALSGCLAVAVFGTGWYFGYVRSRVKRESAFAHVWGEAHLLQATENAEEEQERGYQPPRVITPLFGWERNPERLMALGAAMVDDGWLEVLRLEELPEQTMLVASLAADDTMRELSDAAYRIGGEADVRVAFHDVLTHNAKRAAADHAEKTRAEWMLMAWPERDRRATLVRNPMAWWMDHSPCDLAVLKDRGEPAYKRVLVIAKPGPYDSLVMHLADRIAARAGGSLTLVRLVAEQAEPMQIDGYKAYHRELAQLCRCATQSVVLRTPHAGATIAEMSADYDLLVLGAARESSARTLLFGSPEDRMAGAARCSVLMVKAPRHAVHSRFPPPEQGRLEFGGLGLFTTWAACGAQLEVKNKEDLLGRMARRHSEVLGVDMSEAILAKLHKREQQQPTALAGGVALIGATKNGIPATSLGAFTVDRKLAWKVRGGSRGVDQVDVCLVVLSPPGERRTQLWMLGRLSRMIHAGGFLAALRAAEDETELLEVIRDADDALDAFFDGADTSTDWAPVEGPS